MILSKQHIKQSIITLAVLFCFSCEKDPEQHLELGNWYLQKGLIDEAITEYREVSRLLPLDHSKLNRGEFKVIGDIEIWSSSLRETPIRYALSFLGFSNTI